MNNKKMKKTVATILACAVTCSVLPASESFAARNNNKNWGNSVVTSGSAVQPVSFGGVEGKRPETVSHGAIWNNPDVQGDWDFSDIFSWFDNIKWDDINWGNSDWGDIDLGNPDWNDSNWGDVQDWFPVTGGAIGGGKPQESWPEINWPVITQRPVSGGAIGGGKPQESWPEINWPEIDWPGNSQKPVSGGAIDADQPNKGNGENQKPTTPDNGKENETQKPTTPDNGKENEAQTPTTPDNGKNNETQKPTTPDNSKENGAGQKPGNGATDSHKQPATATDGAVKGQDQNAKDANKEQKPVENQVPADTVSNGAIKATKKKKAKIKVPVASKKMKKGKKYKIKYSVLSGSGKVTFKSSNKKVATVNAKGIVTTKKKGTAIITVKITVK